MSGGSTILQLSVLTYLTPSAAHDLVKINVSLEILTFTINARRVTAVEDTLPSPDRTSPRGQRDVNPPRFT
jgi:hypothetical protein